MTENEKKVSEYCCKTSDKYGTDCEKMCVVDKLCMNCGGDFSSMYDKGVMYADVAADKIAEAHAEDVANGVLVEYYKKQLDIANAEIATLKEMNKILVESIKNLSEK